MEEPTYTPEENPIPTGDEPEEVDVESEEEESGEYSDDEPEEVDVEPEDEAENPRTQEQAEHGNPHLTKQNIDQQQAAINAAIQRYENELAELTDAIQQLSHHIENNHEEGNGGTPYLKLRPEDDKLLFQHIKRLSATVSNAAFLLGETYLPRAKSTPSVQATKELILKLHKFITKYKLHPFHQATYNHDKVRIYLYDPIIAMMELLHLQIGEISACLTEYAEFAKHDYVMVSTGHNNNDYPPTDPIYPYGERDHYRTGRWGRLDTRETTYPSYPHHPTEWRGDQQPPPQQEPQQLVDPAIYKQRVWGER